MAMFFVVGVTATNNQNNLRMKHWNFFRTACKSGDVRWSPRLLEQWIQTPAREFTDYHL